MTLEKWEPEPWSKLKSALESRLERKQLDLHRESAVGGTRILRISLPSAGLDFSNANVVPEKLEGQDRATYASVLRCWSEVRALIRAAGLADYSQEDKAWLDSR